jgi:hypothetical protein
MDPHDNNVLQGLLDRLVRKTEEIQVARQKLARLENEREEIRQQLRGYFEEDAETKEADVASAEHGRLFGYYSKASVRTEQLPNRQPRVFVSWKAPKSLHETADAVGRLAEEVDAGRLAKELAISLEAARLRLSRACSAGLVKRIGIGKYVVSTDSSCEEPDISF